MKRKYEINTHTKKNTWTCKSYRIVKELSFWLDKWALCTISNDENDNNPLEKQTNKQLTQMNIMPVSSLGVHIWCSSKT